MNIKPPLIEVPTEKPFDNDKFERDKEAELLTSIISTYSQPLVLSIDAAWGNGKTTFLQMWRQKLENEKFPCLFFNAWEHDFADNALVSFIGEIDAGIDAFPLGPEETKEAKQLFRNVKTIGTKLLKRAAPIAIKLITAGVLDPEKVYEDAIGTVGSELVKDSFKEYEENRNTVSDFKKKLRDFVLKLQEFQGETPKPLVFFIDEMDRCRPPYAIQLLEKIKHFFDIEGIIFVLAIDKTQIENSIKFVYGTDESSAYLHRFIDLTYRLKKPSKEQYASILFNRLELSSLWEKRGFSSIYNETLKLFQTFSNCFSLSLREQERVAAHLNVIIRTLPKGNTYQPELLVILIVLRTKHYSLYTSIAQGTLPNRILEMLRKTSEGTEFLESTRGLCLEFVINFEGSPVSKAIRKYKEIQETINSSELEDIFTPELRKQQHLSLFIKSEIESYPRETDKLNLLFRIFQLVELAKNFDAE